MERELFLRIVALIRSMPERSGGFARCDFTDGEILIVYFFAVLHDRPVSWATQKRNWPIHDRKRTLPSNSTMSRRLRTARMQQLIRKIQEKAFGGEPAEGAVCVIDGKPLTIGGNSGDRDAGFGRAAGTMAKGYKLHAIVGAHGSVHAWMLKPMNFSEQAAARELLPQLPADRRITVLADGNYDSNELYDLAGERRICWLAAKRFSKAQGLGHQKHSGYRLFALDLQERDPGVLRGRTSIERHFGLLGNHVGGMPPLPNAVRGLARVTRWVGAKLVINAIYRRAQRGETAA